MQTPIIFESVKRGLRWQCLQITDLHILKTRILLKWILFSLLREWISNTSGPRQKEICGDPQYKPINATHTNTVCDYQRYSFKGIPKQNWIMSVKNCCRLCFTSVTFFNNSRIITVALRSAEAEYLHEVCYTELSAAQVLFYCGKITQCIRSTLLTKFLV